MDAKLNSDYLKFTSNGILNNVSLIASSATITFNGTDTGALVTLSNIKNPTDPQDAATKNYVDSASGSTPGGTQGSVQYKNGSIFTGDNYFRYDGTLLTVNGITSSKALSRLVLKKFYIGLFYHFFQ